MFYTPKFCCDCREKIEPNDRKWLSSRRFCRLCETKFVPHEWIPRVIVIFGLIGVLFGFAGYFQKNEKPLRISSNNISGDAPPSKKDLSESPATIPGEAKSGVQTTTQTAAAAIEQRREQSAPAAHAFVQKTQRESAEDYSAADERVYFCGAMTKKGTACSRRVKGGGRCWQHAGQTAILPQEKLIASR